MYLKVTITIHGDVNILIKKFLKKLKSYQHYFHSNDRIYFLSFWFQLQKFMIYKIMGEKTLKINKLLQRFLNYNILYSFNKNPFKNLATFEYLDVKSIVNWLRVKFLGVSICVGPKFTRKVPLIRWEGFRTRNPNLYK